MQANNHYSIIIDLVTLICLLNIIPLYNAEELVSHPDVYLKGFKDEKEKTWVDVVENPSSMESIITQENYDFTVNSNLATEMVLTCNASYPVYWEIKNVQTTQLNKISTNSKAIYTENGNTFDLQEFQAYLHLRSTRSLTGEYVCKSVSNHDQKKSVYIFLQDNTENSSAFVFEPSTIKHVVTVWVTNEDNSVILPCRVTKKDAKVSLWKPESNNTVTDAAKNWVEVLGLNETRLEFDPKIGFSISFDTVDNLSSRFKCSIPNNTDEVIIDLKFDKEHHLKPTFTYRNISDGIGTWREREFGDGIECCSNSSVPPSFKGIPCENKPHCDMIKQIFVHILNFQTRDQRLIETGRSPRTGNNSGLSCTFTATFLLVKPFLLQCLGEGIDYSGVVATEFFPPPNPNINYVGTPANDEQYIYSVDRMVRVKAYTIVNNTVDGEVEEALKEINLKTYPIYHGDPIILDCCGSFYQHAIGRIQRIEWKNKTFTTLKTPDQMEEPSSGPYIKDFCYTYQYLPEDIETFTLTADRNMDYFDCMIPRWNQKEPAIKRVKLNIRELTAPQWATNKTEFNITYDENQVGILRLDCDLEYGDPLPKMTWRKDGYKINQTDKYWSLVSTNDEKYLKAFGSSLLFMRAVKEIEGEFLCIASNNEGTVEKLFYVSVTPRSYLDYWLALGVFGSFFILIACCALRVSTLDRQPKPNFKKIRPQKEREPSL